MLLAEGSQGAFMGNVCLKETRITFFLSLKKLYLIEVHFEFGELSFACQVLDINVSDILNQYGAICGGFGGGE